MTLLHPVEPAVSAWTQAIVQRGKSAAHQLNKVDDPDSNNNSNLGGEDAKSARHNVADRASCKPLQDECVRRAPCVLEDSDTYVGSSTYCS